MFPPASPLSRRAPPHRIWPPGGTSPPSAARCWCALSVIAAKFSDCQRRRNVCRSRLVLLCGSPAPAPGRRADGGGLRGEEIVSRMRKLVVLAAAVSIAALVAALAACSGGGSDSAAAEPAAPVCPKSSRASWQKLANEIKAPVYCPSWFPHPLGGKFSGRFFNGRSVDPDRSYLVSWAWFESGGGVIQEVHVNLRGYPGSTRIPTCEDTLRSPGRRFGRRSRASATTWGEREWGERLSRSTRRTRAPTCGMSSTRGDVEARSIRSPSTSRLRTPSSRSSRTSIE